MKREHVTEEAVNSFLLSLIRRKVELQSDMSELLTVASWRSSWHRLRHLTHTTKHVVHRDPRVFHIRLAWRRCPRERWAVTHWELMKVVRVNNEACGDKHVSWWSSSSSSSFYYQSFTSLSSSLSLYTSTSFYFHSFSSAVVAADNQTPPSPGFDMFSKLTDNVLVSSCTLYKNILMFLFAVKVLMSSAPPL